MSHRLASLQTPTRSRAGTPSPSPSRASPQPIGEAPHHRHLKTVLLKVQDFLRTWEDIAAHGIKAATACIDHVTQMDNILQQPEGPERPAILPHLEKLAEARVSFQSTVTKLEKLVETLIVLIEKADMTLFEALRTQRVEVVLVEPLWLSWTMEHFIDSLQPLLTAHIQLLTELKTVAAVIMSSDSSFEDAKTAVERWRDLCVRGARRDLVLEWEELVDIELHGPNSDEDEDEKPPRRARGHK